MKLMALTTVAYHPEPALFGRLSSALALGIHVWMFDNTPGGSMGIAPLMNEPHFHLLHHNHQNKGLGMAMQELMLSAAAAGYDALLYFDQDTLFEPRTLQWILAWLQGRGLPAYAAVQFTSEQAVVVPAVAPLHPKTLLINSGCLFVAANLKALGGHDPAFFVEAVDYKFCLDAVHKGYQLAQVPTAPGIDHTSLQPAERRQWLGKTYTFRIYPHPRRWQFTISLLRLAFTAATRRQWLYCYVFLRNIGTFTITQGAYECLRLFGKAPRQTTAA
jgi:rhamnosyltransferase